MAINLLAVLTTWASLATDVVAIPCNYVKIEYSLFNPCIQVGECAGQRKTYSAFSVGTDVLSCIHNQHDRMKSFRQEKHLDS